jgi:hypothetical protein
MSGLQEMSEDTGTREKTTHHTWRNMPAIPVTRDHQHWSMQRKIEEDVPASASLSVEAIGSLRVVGVRTTGARVLVFLLELDIFPNGTSVGSSGSMVSSSGSDALIVDSVYVPLAVARSLVGKLIEALQNTTKRGNDDDLPFCSSSSPE